MYVWLYYKLGGKEKVKKNIANKHTHLVNSGYTVYREKVIVLVNYKWIPLRFNMRKMSERAKKDQYFTMKLSKVHSKIVKVFKIMKWFHIISVTFTDYLNTVLFENYKKNIILNQIL